MSYIPNLKREFNNLPVAERNTNLRSLFDCYASEWDSHNESAKLAILHRFRMNGWNVSRLLHVFGEMYNEGYRPDVFRDSVFALNRLYIAAHEEGDEDLASEIFQAVGYHGLVGTCYSGGLEWGWHDGLPHTETIRGIEHLRM